jgi:hypothetical protein
MARFMRAIQFLLVSCLPKKLDGPDVKLVLGPRFARSGHDN